MDTLKAIFSKVNVGLTGWPTLIVAWIGFAIAALTAVADLLNSLPLDGNQGALVVAIIMSLKAFVTDVLPRLKGQMPRPMPPAA